MGYPYRFIGPEDGYTLESIRRGILVEKEESAAGDFPHTIREHFWIRGGEHDGDSWISCGELDNGNYFFYTASCDYTGFDCQGGMNLWVSSSWKNIIDHAMPEGHYKLYLEQTEDKLPPRCDQCGRHETLYKSLSPPNSLMCNLCMRYNHVLKDEQWGIRPDETGGRFSV